MVHNGNVPHDALRQLVQEDGMLGKGEVDLEKKRKFPNLSIILILSCMIKRRANKQGCVYAVLKKIKCCAWPNTVTRTECCGINKIMQICMLLFCIIYLALKKPQNHFA